GNCISMNIAASPFQVTLGGDNVTETTWTSKIPLEPHTPTTQFLTFSTTSFLYIEKLYQVLNVYVVKAFTAWQDISCH
ncbi:hypothetical protein VIGAN_05077800, partial [Vigna angularis var. angularis]